MIVWINGAFGSGKTTTARTIVGRVANAQLVNIEKIGTMVRAVIPAELGYRDFQDEPLWRETVRSTLLALDRRSLGPLVVPMTVVHGPWFEEIIGGLRADGVDVRHVALMVSPAELRRRIRRGIVSWPPTPPQWRHQQAERCLHALEHERFKIHIDANGPAPEVSASVLQACDLGLPHDSNGPSGQV